MQNTQADTFVVLISYFSQLEECCRIVDDEITLYCTCYDAVGVNYL